MNSQPDLERRIADFYAREAPPRAPDWVLDSALATIGSTRQRRALAGVTWRLNDMNGFAKLAMAAVVVVAAGLVGMSVLQPAGGPGVGGPQPSPSASASAAPSPTRTPLPTPSPYVPPPLSETFTSTINGLTLSYPTGWTTQPASESWTTPGLPVFLQPGADFMYDPIRTDHLFLAVASRPLGATSLADGAATWLEAEACAAPTQAIAIDGEEGLIAEECRVAMVASGGRAYALSLYKSDDEVELRTFDARAWFEEILGTVSLDPAAARDVAPSASP